MEIRLERKIQLGPVEVVLCGTASTDEQRESVARVMEKATMILTSRSFSDLAGLPTPQAGNCSGS